MVDSEIVTQVEHAYARTLWYTLISIHAVMADGMTASNNPVSRKNGRQSGISSDS
jgi:hypothetical protein